MKAKFDLADAGRDRKDIRASAKPSFQQFMDKRNPWKRGMDLKRAVEIHPPLAPYIVGENYNGVDWSNDTAQRELVTAIAKADLGVGDFVVPEGHLVPTFPSRANYLLWVADLVASVVRGSEADAALARSRELGGEEYKPQIAPCRGSDVEGDPLRGIDIGTGASAVFPVLGHALFGWRFLATEVDGSSVEHAKRLVGRNMGEGNVRVLHVEEGELFGVIGDEGVYGFSVCNPPFFEVGKGDDGHPDRAKEGTELERETVGGERGFVGKLVESSARENVRDKVVWFTTWLGHKASVGYLCGKARQMGARAVRSTVLAQGRMLRWAVAWSFFDETCFPPPPKVHDATKLGKSGKGGGEQGAVIRNISPESAWERIEQCCRESKRCTTDLFPPSPPAQNDHLPTAGSKRPRSPSADLSAVMVKRRATETGCTVLEHDIQVHDTVADAKFQVAVTINEIDDLKSDEDTLLAFGDEKSDQVCAVRFEMKSGENLRAFGAWCNVIIGDIVRQNRRWRRRRQQEEEKEK